MDPRAIKKTSPSAQAHNERNPGEQDAKKHESWRHVIMDSNAHSRFPFSHHVIQVLLRQPERAPSADEQPRQAQSKPSKAPTARMAAKQQERQRVVEIGPELAAEFAKLVKQRRVTRRLED